MAIGVQVTFDTADPGKLAEFWAVALGYVVQPPPDGFESWPEAARAFGIPEELWDARSAVVDPDGRGPRLFFQRVPEGKTAKNRVHLDVNASAGASDPDEKLRLIDAHVETLIGHGATVLRRVEESSESFVVMQDPEGNEFCVQ